MGERRGNMNGKISTALALWILCGSAVWGQGYIIRGNQIVVEGRHLKIWGSPSARWSSSPRRRGPTALCGQGYRRDPRPCRAPATESTKGVKAEDVDLLDAVSAVQCGRGSQPP